MVFYNWCWMADLFKHKTGYYFSYPLLALSQKDQVWGLWPRWLPFQHSYILHSWKPCGTGPEAGRMGLFYLQQPLLVQSCTGQWSSVRQRKTIFWVPIRHPKWNSAIKRNKELLCFVIWSQLHLLPTSLSKPSDSRGILPVLLPVPLIGSSR